MAGPAGPAGAGNAAGAFDFGYLSTKLLYLVITKGWPAAKAEMKIPDDGLYDTGVETVTPATVKDYKKGLEKLGITSS